MDRENVVREKSFGLAVRIVKMSQYLQKERSEYVLSRQVVRSGTSIGANIEEALAAQSRRDFAAKMAIASKESRETLYWLRLLKETGYIRPDAAQSIQKDCEEVTRLLTSIVKSAQENQ